MADDRFNTEEFDDGRAGVKMAYRIAPPSKPLRPLNPEDEMRLLLGRRNVTAIPVGIWCFSALGVGLVVAGVVYEAKYLIVALYYFVPLVLVAHRCWKHRREVERLRAAGYDVDALPPRSRMSEHRVVAGNVPQRRRPSLRFGATRTSRP